MLEIAGGIILAVVVLVVAFYAIAGIALVRSDTKQMRRETEQWRKRRGLTGT